MPEYGFYGKTSETLIERRRNWYICVEHGTTLEIIIQNPFTYLLD